MRKKRLPLQALKGLFQVPELLLNVVLNAAGLPSSTPLIWLSMPTSATLGQATELSLTEQRSLALTHFLWVKTLLLATTVSELWCWHGCGTSLPSFC